MTDTNDVTDLWGDIATEPVRTPLAILREQGAILERRTNGILTVKISSDSNTLGTFRHAFSIKATNLNYHYEAFAIFHPIELYPVEVVSESLIPFGGKVQQAHNEDQFLQLLRRVLQSDKIQKVISALLSQDIAA